MTLSAKDAIAATKDMLVWRDHEKERLNKIHAYLHGTQAHPSVPAGTQRDIRRIADISRVNMMKIVVNALTQSLYVDGFRQHLANDNAPVWDVWQANRMDRGQIAVHRAALAYGLSYVTVLPGDTAPVIRGFSPRTLTAVYSVDEPDWPTMALRAEPTRDRWIYRLYDDEAVYFLNGPEKEGDDIEFISFDVHDMGVTPVVRFLNEEDLDDDQEGEVEPLMDLQDQVDFTTFGLLVAQHYAAFRQRYVIGMLAESEQEALKMGAARMLTIEEETAKVGEFEQTQLDGYINSRIESLKQMASISQTPVHELIGSLVNLSAEALVAAEAGQQRKVAERKTTFGESWEQVFELAGAGETDAQVRWRDTESRALGALVDALGKMAQMLGIPQQELWDRLPNVTQSDIDRWKEAKANEVANDPVSRLNAQMTAQADRMRIVPAA